MIICESKQVSKKSDFKKKTENTKVFYYFNYVNILSIIDNNFIKKTTFDCQFF